jgi:L-ascorbate metabolism protein UlaG (beta-lactamase superfamily)
LEDGDNLFNCLSFTGFSCGESFSVDFEGFDVYWDGHASVRVEDKGFTVAVDPFSKLDTDFEADIVLVTHAHAGHFDRDALEEVKGDRTVFVFPDSFEEVPFRDSEFLGEGEKIDIYEVEIEAVPMYNDEHLRRQGVGYRFSMNGTSFYVAGDTGLTEEMRDLEKKIDLAFLPVDGQYTMDVDEAVQAAVRIKPSLAIPYHFRKPFFPDSRKNAEKFAAELKDRSIDSKVLSPESLR